MVYELDGRAPVGRTVPAILAEELDGAVARLRDDADRARGVHEARRHLKKTRSALRLVRGALDHGVLGREQERLRQAARRLSATRDAQVAVATLDRLVGARGGAVGAPRPDPGLVAAVRGDLAGRAADAEAALDGAVVGTVAGDLAAARADLARLELRADGWRALRDGLRHEYRRGRAAAGEVEAAQEPDAEQLHAWRRRVKDLWYHLRLLSPAWPWVLEDTAEQAHDLSELLGDDHDLANLRALLAGRDDAAPLLAAVDARRADLQAAARRLGDRLYAEPPGDFTARMGAYYRAWRTECGGSP
jgi:CHAD domain-containing protein